MHVWLYILFSLYFGQHRLAAQYFAPVANYYVTNSSVVVSITAASVNGNGVLDIIAANGFTNSVSVLTNNGDGIFGFNATYIVGDQPYPQKPMYQGQRRLTHFPFCVSV